MEGAGEDAGVLGVLRAAGGAGGTGGAGEVLGVVGGAGESAEGILGALGGCWEVQGRGASQCNLGLGTSPTSARGGLQSTGAQTHPCDHPGGAGVELRLGEEWRLGWQRRHRPGCSPDTSG